MSNLRNFHVMFLFLVIFSKKCFIYKIHKENIKKEMPVMTATKEDFPQFMPTSFACVNLRHCLIIKVA